MAGIFGLLGQHDEPGLQAMARRLAHRGAKLHFREVANGVNLGCVSDHGAMGIVEEDRWTLVGDLALYNASELRALVKWDVNEPLDAGKLVLGLYQRFGDEGLVTINGDFALALWDSGAHELILARDFAGVRPLYYTRLASGSVAFASEYKALLALEEVSAETDLDMVQWLQHSKHLPSDRTLLRDVRAVPPGSAIAIGHEGQWRRNKQFPPLRLAVERPPLEAAQRSISQAFMGAIESRVAHRATVGIALSGGIDSMGVACATRRLLPEGEIHTFTAGSGPDDPEILRAELVANQIGATQHSIIVTPTDVAALLPRVVWHLENPIARSETVQFYALGQEAGSIVDMVLTGVAADGLFAGMPRHKLLWLIHYLRPLRGPLTEFYSLTQTGRPPESTLGRLMERLYFHGDLPTVPTIRGSEYRPELPHFPGHGAEFLNEVLCTGFQESVAGWLPKLERTFRAGGVSFASPFLDPNMMRLAFTIPSAYKLRRGKEKYVFRQAMRSIVPTEVWNAPKFPMKMKHDLKFSEVLDTLADRILSRERIQRRGWMEIDTMEKLRRRGPTRPYSSEGAMRLWTALLTEIWACQFIDQRGAEPVSGYELDLTSPASAVT